MGESLKYGFSVVIIIAIKSVLTADRGPIFNDDVANVQVIAGQTAWLPCNARHKGNHKIIWMNPVKIVFSNGELMVIDDKRVMVERTEHGDWNLRIDHVRFNDSGQYQCVINTSPVKVKNVYLRVQVPLHILHEDSSRDMDKEEGETLEMRCKATGAPMPKITCIIVSLPPHILHEDSSRDMDKEEGETLELRCKATGVPMPNITWYKRTQLTMDVQENLHVEGELLTIPSIQRYQKGMYICHANNGVPPPKSRQMEIKVQYAPVVKVLTKRLGQFIGKTTVLECSVTSYPRAKIMWIKDGYQIKHSYKYRLEVYPGEADEFTLSLEIPALNRNDYGDYVCEAENRMGIESAIMELYEYIEYTRPAPTTTPNPWTTTEFSGYIDEEYYREEDRQDGYALQVGRAYSAEEYSKSKLRNRAKNSQGANKPFYQTTASSGHRSDIPWCLLAPVTMIFTFNLLEHL